MNVNFEVSANVNGQQFNSIVFDSRSVLRRVNDKNVEHVEFFLYDGNRFMWVPTVMCKVTKILSLPVDVISLPGNSEQFETDQEQFQEEKEAEVELIQILRKNARQYLASSPEIEVENFIVGVTTDLNQ